MGPSTGTVSRLEFTIRQDSRRGSELETLRCLQVQIPIFMCKTGLLRSFWTFEKEKCGEDNCRKTEIAFEIRPADQ